MYGLVNRATEEMVCSRFGNDTWDQIRQTAGLAEISFGSLDRFPDPVTYQLIRAAAEVLDMPAEELLESFGEDWTLYTAQESYGDMMAMFGKTFAEFLGNLDHMHGHIAVAMPELRPPSFRCAELGDGRYRLHYHSTRDGLAPMVVGLIKGLAERFEIAVSVTHCAAKAGRADHDEFLIEPAAS